MKYLLPVFVLVFLNVGLVEARVDYPYTSTCTFDESISAYNCFRCSNNYYYVLANFKSATPDGASPYSVSYSCVYPSCATPTIEQYWTNPDTGTVCQAPPAPIQAPNIPFEDPTPTPTPDYESCKKQNSEDCSSIPNCHRYGNDVPGGPCCAIGGTPNDIACAWQITPTVVPPTPTSTATPTLFSCNVVAYRNDPNYGYLSYSFNSPKIANNESIRPGEEFLIDTGRVTNNTTAVFSPGSIATEIEYGRHLSFVNSYSVPPEILIPETQQLVFQIYGGDLLPGVPIDTFSIRTKLKPSVNVNAIEINTKIRNATTRELLGKCNLTLQITGVPIQPDSTPNLTKPNTDSWLADFLSEYRGSVNTITSDKNGDRKIDGKDYVLWIRSQPKTPPNTCTQGQNCPGDPGDVPNSAL